MPWIVWIGWFRDWDSSRGGNETRPFACQEKEVLCNKEADAISPCCEGARVSCTGHGSGSQTLLRVIADVYPVTLVKKLCWGSEYDASCRQVYIDQCFMLCLDLSLHMHHQVREDIAHRHAGVVIQWVCVTEGDQILWRFLPHTVTAASCICTTSSLSYRVQPLSPPCSAPQGLSFSLVAMHQASFPQLTLGNILHALCEMEEKVILETSDHSDPLQMKWCLHKPSKPLKETC